ncbi:hypothetical protein QQ045_010098 [Rhodiola kirilowii]
MSGTQTVCPVSSSDNSSLSPADTCLLKLRVSSSKSGSCSGRSGSTNLVEGDDDFGLWVAVRAAGLAVADIKKGEEYRRSEKKTAEAPPSTLRGCLLASSGLPLSLGWSLELAMVGVTSGGLYMFLGLLSSYALRDAVVWLVAVPTEVVL